MATVATFLTPNPNSPFRAPNLPPVQVFYLFAIAAVSFFRENDPWHFSNIGITFVTLFRVATLEDWTDVMYINMYGCDKYQSTYAGDAATGLANGADPMYWCEHPKAYPLFAAVFWVIFVLISAFILLSLFIGAVTVSMGEIMDQIQIERVS